MFQKQPKHSAPFQSFLDWLRQRNYRFHFLRWLESHRFEEILPREAQESTLPLLREAFATCGDNEEEFWEFLSSRAQEPIPSRFSLLFRRKRPSPMSMLFVVDTLQALATYYFALREGELPLTTSQRGY